MQYLVFGLLALFVILIAMRGFVGASPHLVATRVRIATGVAAFAIAAVLMTRGLVGYAIPAAMFGIWLLASNKPLGWPSGWGGTQNPAQSSRVVTDTLEMELDLSTGEMHGRVLKGVFAGRAVERMAPAELALLWRDCQFADPSSAQLIEAYLDRRHPTWKEDMARAESEPGAGGIMTTAEAYEILGLKPGASTDDIRRAHRELMLRMHPDRGGSTYLASKINEAKDLLLKRTG